ncbi:SRPBCC family protein [Edaphocola flava]|uniref:hypothetical protein n=1 Tax=Edaphocola flava TaxID=2499629 RepID=UPI00100A2CF1|nr:hypothetical protein [Edaphocola flava]
MTNKNKAVTYSILSHIRNNGELIKGPLDVFIPLIKRVIASLNRKEIYSGKSIGEIKAEADELYSLDFPIPVLKTILNRIAIEVNTEDATRFFLYADGSFAISKYTFDEFEEVFNEKKKEIDNIESLYITFKESTESTNDSENIFKFIERNKHSLCKFFSIKGETNGEDYTLEAQFINFFKSIPSVYEVIEDIYLGSIIACYVEYQPHINTGEVELILDTNFIVGLLDLNTPESTHTCRTLVQVAISSGYKITVLKATIDETENLLKNKAHNFDKSFLQKKN